jgi:hypothetical protein
VWNENVRRRKGGKRYFNPPPPSPRCTSTHPQGVRPSLGFECLLALFPSYFNVPCAFISLCLFFSLFLISPGILCVCVWLELSLLLLSCLRCRAKRNEQKSTSATLRVSQAVE